MSATEIMAVTGHNQQSFTDYDELDDEDHSHLIKILSSETTTSKQLAQVPAVHMSPTFNPLQPLNLPVAMPNYVIPSAPVFNIQNSTVIFGYSSSSLS